MKKLITASLILSVSGCSLMAPSQQAITVVPSNPNAQVYVDGNMVGKGPQSIMMNRGSTHSVMAKCPKSSGVAMVERKMSTTGILDIVGGFIFLIPFVGLFGDGSHDLTPSAITVGIPDESSCG